MGPLQTEDDLKEALVWTIAPIRLLLVALPMLTLVSGAAAAAPRSNAGTLALEGVLHIRDPPTACPAGTGESVECYARAGSGVVRGLGDVNGSYPYLIQDSPPGCDVFTIRLLPTTARLSVPGKGEIDVRVDGSACVIREAPVFRSVEVFTVTGGSGRYAGASGGGTLAKASNGPPAWSGTDTWSGTLVVPGLDFDLTPPVLTGAYNRTLRALRRRKLVRVAYTVTAHDAVDGALPVTCLPPSRSWFTLGRTGVRCSAIDTSGNEGTAAFTVTVKRRR